MIKNYYQTISLSCFLFKDPTCLIKMISKPLVLLMIGMIAGVKISKAQDPSLPATNLGITNMQDGNAPAKGWYYMQYIQAYQASHTKDGLGHDKPNAPAISSIVAMQQVVFINKDKFLNGNIGFTVILPLAKVSAVNPDGPAPIINPNPMGDITAGLLVQWFNRMLFGMNYSHRLEIDMGIPVGAYQSRYDINPSAHMFRVFPHYTFTLSPTRNLSFSMRHHFNYYFDEIGSRAKPGISYNLNYSAEYTLAKAITVEIAGYYLTQLGQDSFNGDSRYYQKNFGIQNTKEKVFAYGPGIGYVSPTGLFVELKGMQETGVKNRAEGFRTTLVLSYKLDK
jgi:hypothetical protein